MTVIKKIEFTTNNKKIKPILINDNHINVLLLDNNKVFKFYNNGKTNKVAVVQFRYIDNIVSQAFYECSGEYNGTWLPFDGIKGDVDEKNNFYKYMDTAAFCGDVPFGSIKLMAVSYILGGGVWANKETKFKDTLKVEERTSTTIYTDITDIGFQDSLVINHYINYAISRNYFESNPDEKLRPSSPQWIKDSKKNKNDQRIFSAFDFSAKMNNSFQLEYTPSVISKFNTRKDYESYYKRVDKGQVIIERKATSCNIL